MATDFDGVKVFSATKARERSSLGELATAWIKETGHKVVEARVKQSSDHEYHCISIILFYNEGLKRRRTNGS